MREGLTDVRKRVDLLSLPTVLTDTKYHSWCDLTTTLAGENWEHMYANIFKLHTSYAIFIYLCMCRYTSECESLHLHAPYLIWRNVSLLTLEPHLELCKLTKRQKENDQCHCMQSWSILKKLHHQSDKCVISACEWSVTARDRPAKLQVYR